MRLNALAWFEGWESPPFGDRWDLVAWCSWFPRSLDPDELELDPPWPRLRGRRFRFLFLGEVDVDRPLMLTILQSSA